jgi:intracellular multiplication protein IcmJ
MSGRAKLLPLKLAVGSDQLQLFIRRNNDKGFARFQQKVAARDKHACRFCGFESQTGFCTLNIDGNYGHNKLSNMVNSCPICAQCTFLDGVGLPSFPGGALIYTPEISQSEINAMAHVLFQSIYLDDESASQSKNLYRTLRLRSQLVEKQLGEDLSNPSTYARMLIDADPKQAKAFNEKVCESIRLLPDMVGFLPMVRSWQVSAFNELT